MTSIIQCIFISLIGIALSLFGVIHTVSSYPGSNTFHQFAVCLPALGSVLFFFLCILAAVAGVFVLIWSVRRLRYRWQFLRTVTARHSESPHLHRGGYHGNGEMEDEETWAGAYR